MILIKCFILLCFHLPEILTNVSVAGLKLSREGGNLRLFTFN